MKFTIDTHTHTLVSGHAYNTIDEMAAFAAEKGVTRSEGHTSELQSR